jgi:aerobic-type carbon monoxide dehydrogenase small subunit (CoxS/CutS family)
MRQWYTWVSMDPSASTRGPATGEPAPSWRVRLTLNGSPVDLLVDPAQPLCDIIRDELRLTGTKVGCRLGVCGLCTVLVDGLPASSCLLLAPMLEGRSLTTVEGLGGPGNLDPVQQAFAEEQGFQCGICTPGQVLAAHALLAHEPQPDEARIREWMTGNLCRCTGYASIVRSVQEAARRVEAGTTRVEGHG